MNGWKRNRLQCPAVLGGKDDLSQRQKDIDEWWNLDHRMPDETVACYLRNWMDQNGTELDWDDAYDSALNMISQKGSSRDRKVVAKYRAERKETGSLHQVTWGKTAKTEEYITQQLCIGDLDFDVVDFGESIPLTDHCRKLITCPDYQENKQCTLLHWADAVEWNAQKRGARIPLRSRVYQIAQQARMGEATIARTVSLAVSDGGRLCELQSLLHDAYRAHHGRDFRTIGLAMKPALGAISDVELRILDINNGSTDVVGYRYEFGNEVSTPDNAIYLVAHKGHMRWAKQSE